MPTDGQFNRIFLDHCSKVFFENGFPENVNVQDVIIDGHNLDLASVVLVAR